MVCSRCGHTNEEGSRFCSGCGAPVEGGQRGRRKINFAALLMGILNVLLAAVIVLMATGVTGAIFAPPRQSGKPEETGQSAAAQTLDNSNVINVWSFTSEVPQMMDAYIRANPYFRYTIEPLTFETIEIDYETALSEALAGKVIEGVGAPDIYCVESAYATRFTQGDISSYAMPYEDLGIDVEAETRAAKTARYVIDIGTRTSDGKLVSLGYQATGGAFIYRRSIAKDVWGTDDPGVIKTKIGPGWDRFFEAAAELKKKGYAIVSGDGDIWHSVENSADKGWISDGRLYIDPKREAFLDYSKELIDKGYSNGTRDWTDEWYSDMSGAGPRPVFGFFGPVWLINYVMKGNCGAEFDEDGKLAKAGGTWGDWAVCEPTEAFFWGGTWILASRSLENDPRKKAAAGRLIDWITLNCTKDGLQYAWANGTLDFGYGPSGIKDEVISGAVMEACDGTLPFLGGQDMFGVFLPANEAAKGSNISKYDLNINTLWREQARLYAHGVCSREDAIAAFKEKVMDQLGLEAW